MKTRTFLVILFVAIVAAVADNDVLQKRQQGKLFPVLNPDLLHQFEVGSFAAFASYPMREEFKVGYALALSGYWLVKGDLSTSEAYNDLALELAQRYALKNEEAQAIMGSALLADALENRSKALEKIQQSVDILKEVESGTVLYDAMFCQAALQRKYEMKKDSIKTLIELQSLIRGPYADVLRDTCRATIAEIKTELATSNDTKENAQQ